MELNEFQKKYDSLMAWEKKSFVRSNDVIKESFDIEEDNIDKRIGLLLATKEQLLDELKKRDDYDIVAELEDATDIEKWLDKQMID